MVQSEFHIRRQREIVKYAAATIFGFLVCRLHFTYHPWRAEYLNTVLLSKTANKAEGGDAFEFAGSKRISTSDMKLNKEMLAINNMEHLSFTFGSRTRGVEPKRNALKMGSLCATYDSKNDKHKWTTDEGRCIYEYFIANDFAGTQQQHYDGGEEFHGTILEMGVMGGGSYWGVSHSYAYQFDLGWNTILVEANPEMETKIKKNVANKENPATLHMTPICAGEGTYHFVMTSSVGLNGFREFNPFLEEKLAEFNATVIKEVPMKCHSMSSLLRDVPIIDAYFLDVEGAELMVLETIDFQKTCIQLFNIEEHGPGSDLHKFLQTKGFSYVGWNTVSWNYLYVNNQRCRD